MFTTAFTEEEITGDQYFGSPHRSPSLPQTTCLGSGGPTLSWEGYPMGQALLPQRVQASLGPC